MTNTFKRRIYRLSLISAASFFAAFLLYDLGDVGIATYQLYFPCYVFTFIGALFAFKALDIWSSWNEDTSVDREFEQSKGNVYPVTFYTEALLVAISVIFLLVFTFIRNQPTIEESLILTLALFIASFCLFLGHLSDSLE